MNVNLFRKTLREIRISWPSYAIGMAAYIFLLVSIYPSIQERSQELQQVLKSYPKAFLDAFSGGSMPNFVTPEGFLALEIFSFMWFVIIGAFVISYGTGALGKELDSGTIELLLDQPVTRTSTLITKATTLFLATAGLVVVTTGSLYLLAQSFDLQLKTEGVAALTVVGGLFFLAIAAFSLFFSVALKERGRAAAAASGLLVASYILHVLAQYADWAKKLDVISPFYYYNAAELLGTGSIPVKSVLVYLGTIVISFALALVIFDRMDIAP